jgi:hypothetical protein
MGLAGFDGAAVLGDGTKEVCRIPSIEGSTMMSTRRF